MGGPRPGPTGPWPKDGTDHSAEISIFFFYNICFGN